MKQKFKKGDIIRFVENSCYSYGYPMGATAKLLSVNLSNNTATIENKNLSGYNINIILSPQYVKRVALTKKELLDAKKELTEEIDDIESKISWMEETGNEEYDEDEVKVWKTLRLLKDGNLTEVEKAKAIAALIKQ